MDSKLASGILSYILRNPFQTPVLVRQFYFDFCTRFHKKRISEYPNYSKQLEDVLMSFNGDRAFAVSHSMAALEGFLAEVRDLATQDEGVIPVEWDADPTLARFAYAVCRLNRPEVVVETGVAHGITSAFILQALAENGKGHLYSIDLPVFTPGSKKAVGIAVPERLRSRWTLTLGLSAYHLPKLLKKLRKIDLFLHDSNHSYHNQQFEYACAWKYLVNGGLLLSDDVNATDAFIEFAEGQKFHPVCIAQPSKTLLIGTLVKPGPEHLAGAGA